MSVRPKDTIQGDLKMADVVGAGPTAIVEEDISALRASVGATNDAELARRLGYTPGAISQWKIRGRIPRKAISRAMSFAEAEGSGETVARSYEEDQLLRRFRRLGARDRDVVLSVIEVLAGGAK